MHFDGQTMHIAQTEGCIAEVLTAAGFKSTNILATFLYGSKQYNDEYLRCAK